LFEIGSSLREARTRRKLELSHVERETRIRAKYLRALEDERFDILPGAAYTKGFLRTYANYLDLDAQRFVDEYNSRFAPEEELDAPAPVRIRRRRFTLAPWMLALGALAASTALFAWRLASSGGQHTTVQPPPATQTRTTTPLAPVAPPTHTRSATASRIVLVASRGPCWLSVHISSAAGQTVFERTLQPSQTARFTLAHRHLWMRIGAPWNLDATLDGKPIQLPAATGDVVVTPAGLSTTIS
jgi:cytoskeleton protein RodZ